MPFFTNSLNFPNLTSKSEPVTADLLMIADSAAANAPKQALLSTLITGGANLPINTQNANYNLVAADRGKIIFSNLATISSFGYTYTLLAPATAGTGWYCYFENQNLSSFASNTLSPASGLINGRTTFPLQTGNACLLYCDGSNYYTMAQQATTKPIMNSIYAALPGLLGVTQSTTLTQTQGVLLNSNVVTFPFFAPNNGLVDQVFIKVSVGLASSTVTVGIYNDNGVNSSPSGAALGAISLATASGGNKSATFSPSIPIYANQYYWAAIQTSSAVTLSLVNNIMNTLLFPSVGGYTSLFTPGMNLQTLASAYSAGTLPTWSGNANSFQSYLPLIIFAVS